MSAPTTVTAAAVVRALRELGIDPIGIFAVEIGRVEGTVRVERLVTDAEGRYVIDGTEYVTDSQTIEVV